MGSEKYHFTSLFFMTDQLHLVELYVLELMIADFYFLFKVFHVWLRDKHRYIFYKKSFSLIALW